PTAAPPLLRLRFVNAVVAVLALDHPPERVKLRSRGCSRGAVDARHHVRLRIPAGLPEREVELLPERGTVVRIKPPLLHMPDHADDLRRATAVPQIDALAERV